MKPLLGLFVLMFTGGIADAAPPLRVVDGDTLELSGVVFL